MIGVNKGVPMIIKRDIAQRPSIGEGIWLLLCKNRRAKFSALPIKSSLVGEPDRIVGVNDRGFGAAG